MIKRLYLKFLLCILLGVSGPAAAAVISAGTPITTVPPALFDPLGFLTSPLPIDQFLLPIEITGANNLQDWSFNLAFHDSVVAPKDIGGLFQSVYQAEFNAADTTLSNITSSGLLLPDLLFGIAGFSSGVSGDGLLAFVLFEFLPGQATNDPGFSIEGAVIGGEVPEPGSLALFAATLLILAFTRRRFGRIRLSSER